MSFTLSAQNKKEYLLVISKGIVSMTDGLIEHSTKIYQEIKKFGKEKILVDDTETRFPLSLFNYSDLVNHYVANLPPETKDLKIAIVISDSFRSMADFWETICQNKGYQFRVFGDIQEAHNWLIK
ncbi:MAG: hypothetical protein V4717_05690 [Bacteroidota bacterium]